MHSIYFITLQAGAPDEAGLIVSIALFALVLTFITIAQIAIGRKRSNRLAHEKQFLKETFDKELMQQTIEVQKITFDILGRELHDNLGQLLSTAKMLMGIAERDFRPVPDTLIAANETLGQAIDEVRNLGKTLNKEWLARFELTEYLEATIANINRGGALEIRYEMIPVVPLPPESQYILFGVVQEAISNVLHHAEASRLLITMSEDEHYLQMALRDNGRGFDMQTVVKGQGIKNIRQRVTLLKGTSEWQSGEDGTYIFLNIPVKIY